MKMKNETRWLCENAKSLERFSGQWVVFNVDQGVVGCHTSLSRLLERVRKQHTDAPFVLHVPEKSALENPLLTLRKK